MLSSLVLVVALAPSHLIGDGGLVGQAEPVLTVRRGGEERAAVHGWFSWQYGEGLEGLLSDDGRIELQELRTRHIALTSAAAACAVIGSSVTALGLYLTPNFVNVNQPDPGGLVVPIVIAVFGAAVGLAAIPLAQLAPGDLAIEDLVERHNASAAADARLSLSQEVVPGATLTLVNEHSAGRPRARRVDQADSAADAERSPDRDTSDPADVSEISEISDDEPDAFEGYEP